MHGSSKQRTVIAVLEHPEFETLHVDQKWHHDAMISILYAAWNRELSHLTPSSFTSARAAIYIESLAKVAHLHYHDNLSVMYLQQDMLERVYSNGPLLYLGVGSTVFCRKFITAAAHEAIGVEANWVSDFLKLLSKTQPLQAIWMLPNEEDKPTFTIRPFSEVRLNAFRTASTT